MTTKELIRAEIERRITDNTFGAKLELIDILAWLDTLPDESERPTMGYDEAYLNEKIAKASKSWGGVDVDKFMDEIRGREPVSDCNDLEEEIETYFKGWYMDETDQGYILHTPDDHAGLMSVKQVARHFAEWAASYLRYTTKMMGDELEEIAENIYKVPFGTRAEDFKAGAEWQKAKMMEGAVEGEVCILPGHVAYVKEKNNESLKQYLLDNFKAGDEVRIIILPNDEEQ